MTTVTGWRHLWDSRRKTQQNPSLLYNSVTLLMLSFSPFLCSVIIFISHTFFDSSLFLCLAYIFLISPLNLLLIWKNRLLGSFFSPFRWPTQKLLSQTHVPELSQPCALSLLVTEHGAHGNKAWKRAFLKAENRKESFGRAAERARAGGRLVLMRRDFL